MSFAWPAMLLTLLVVPAGIAVYVWLLRRRASAAAELGPLRLGEGATGRRAGWRRQLPPALFLVAIALLCVALARPTAVLALPHREGTVILAFDVSSSMEATDIKPTRMEAAKQAAAAFVRAQPPTIRVGVVAFSDSALVIQQPTNVPGEVLAAIDRIQPQGGTSLAQGILASLGAIAGHPLLPPESTATTTAPAAAATPDLSTLHVDYHGSAAIVLLSDGEDTSRVDPMAAAQVASNAGVHVFTIGVGTPQGTTVDLQGYHVATALNAPLLTRIASATGGTYYEAADAAKLAAIYRTIDLHLTVSGRRTEVTAIFAAAAMLPLLAGAALTAGWFGRVP